MRRLTQVWKKKPKIEDTPVSRVPYFICTANGLIVPTVGQQPVKTMTLSQAFSEVERMEESAKADARAGHIVGADHAMDAVDDLRKAIRTLIDTMEKATADSTMFYF